MCDGTCLNVTNPTKEGRGRSIKEINKTGMIVICGGGYKKEIHL
jgi:hypothetical protein